MEIYDVMFEVEHKQIRSINQQFHMQQWLALWLHHCTVFSAVSAIPLAKTIQHAGVNKTTDNISVDY